MDQLKQLLDTILSGFTFDYQDFAERYFGTYYRRIVTALDFAENSLRDELRTFGLSHSVQTIVLVSLSLLFAFGAFRMINGKIRILFVLVFLALGLHILIPVLDS